MTLYSVVSAALPIVPALCVLGFLTLLAALQMWAGQGPPARLVSQLAGVVVIPGAVWLQSGPCVYIGPEALCVLALLGYVVGYAAGGLVAGAFLIAWHIDRWWAGGRRP
ncbi:MAG: hypothetical protein HYY93_09500 [Planctomycetes bacterium]|nr:hypothetical protein [Planctomycetota bacterium]